MGERFFKYLNMTLQDNWQFHFHEFKLEQALELEQFREMDYYAVENYQLSIELMMENAGLHLARIVSKVAGPLSIIKILWHLPAQTEIFVADLGIPVKLIRNIETDKLIGARIIAPEGGELVQQLSMAIKYGITIKDLAESFYPYLTLGEGIKLAALTFNKDISKLSCCAT